MLNPKFWFLDFSMGRNSGGTYIQVHTKAKKKAKVKLERLTSRSQGRKVDTVFNNIKKKNGRLQYADTIGSEVSNRLVRACHARCRSALEKAIEERLITRNPSIGCKLPPKKGREMQILTQSEIGRFLARAKENAVSPLLSYYNKNKHS